MYFQYSCLHFENKRGPRRRDRMKKKFLLIFAFLSVIRISWFIDVHLCVSNLYRPPKLVDRTSELVIKPLCTRLLFILHDGSMTAVDKHLIKSLHLRKNIAKIKVNCFARVTHPTWSWRFRFFQRIILSWKIVPWWLCCIIVFPRDRWVLFQCIWSLLLVFLFVQATITNFLRRLLWRASNLEDYFLHFNFFHSLESPQLTPLIL